MQDAFLAYFDAAGKQRPHEAISGIIERAGLHRQRLPPHQLLSTPDAPHRRRLDASPTLNSEEPAMLDVRAPLGDRCPIVTRTERQATSLERPAIRAGYARPRQMVPNLCLESK